MPAHNTPMKPGRREVLLVAIAKARRWIKDVEHGHSFADIARREGKPERYVRRIARLAFVSPRIINAVLDGTAPAGLTVTAFAVGLPYSIGLSTLYALAAPSTSEAARVQVIARFEAGERPKHNEVQALLAMHKPNVIKGAAKILHAQDAEVRYAERTAKLIEISKRNAPLPFGCEFVNLYADPAYCFDMTSCGNRAIENHYPTLSLEEICALEVSRVTAPAAVLFLWVPTPLMVTHAPRILDAWGFHYRSGIAWDKEMPGMGFWVREQHEHLLIATKGDMPCPLPANRPRSIIRARRTGHSVKPIEAYEIIEGMYPGDLPRLELFARGPARQGWATWGNEAETVVGSAAPK